MSILLAFGVQLRLVFPTLQENSSPLSVMTLFLGDFGRKIDQADAEKAGMIESWNVMDLAHIFYILFSMNIYLRTDSCRRRTPKPIRNIADQHAWNSYTHILQ